MIGPFLTPKPASARLLVSEKAVLDGLRLGKVRGQRRAAVADSRAQSGGLPREA
jgi:hypothetical protein